MQVSVTVDDREPESLAAAVRAHPDVESVAVARLDAGDVVIGDVGFERKTVGDYLGSAMGRTGTDLEDQVRRLVETYEHAYVLLEGDLAEVETHWPEVSGPAVRGSIASITARFGVPVFPCGDRERLVDLAVRLARKHVEPPARRQLSPGAVPSRDEPVTKRMYSCIEGVGPATAAALYEAYPSVESLLEASEVDLQEIEGIGPKRAERVYAAFRS